MLAADVTLRSPLSDIVRHAWSEGRAIDLSGVGYGRVHWGDKHSVRDDPSPYYYFLAGVVRVLGFSRVLEIGTHWGGATRAMWRGLRDPEAGEFVTVDITDESDARLGDYPRIRKIVGDGNDEPTFRAVVDAFGGAPIDLLYIDAAHQHMPTMISYALYGVVLKPRMVILDDVTLNPTMREAWSRIRASRPERDTINAAELIREIRPSPDDPGFGVVRMPDAGRGSAVR